MQGKLSAVLVGEAGKRNIMALSIKGQPDKKSLAGKILSALKSNDIVKLGEKTGHQVTTLSRLTPDDPGEPVDKVIQEEMISTANPNV